MNRLSKVTLYFVRQVCRNSLFASAGTDVLGLTGRNGKTRKIMTTIWVDSVPAWALGPRASNAKFGGGIILGGIPEVKDRLIAVQKLSKKLKLTHGNELRSSGHILHEVKTNVRKYQNHNAPTAISFSDLKAGIASGKYPLWVAMTAPQFGFKGAERGGMISNKFDDRVMAEDLHTEAITRSQELEQAGLGAGINIWWPAWTSRKLGDPTNPPTDFNDTWETMLEFWVKLLKKTGGTMWLEWKPGDPGSDYLMTLTMAIEFCKAVNAALGRTAMLLNNEFAHVMLEGISVAEGVKRTVEAELFSRFCHANSGQKLPATIESLLKAGTKPGDIMIGTDHDWPVGIAGDMSEGMENTETWADQEKAIGIMDQAGQQIIYCEHDVNPAGLDPLEVFELSIRNRQKMLKNFRETMGYATMA